MKIRCLEKKYIHQNKNTVCVATFSLIDDQGTTVWDKLNPVQFTTKGVAVLNTEDEYDERIGCSIAFTKAHIAAIIKINEWISLEYQKTLKKMTSFVDALAKFDRIKDQEKESLKESLK